MASKRYINCCGDISKLKKITGKRVFFKTFNKIFKLKAVLPTDGRPARIMSSDFCNPSV